MKLDLFSLVKALKSSKEVSVLKNVFCARVATAHTRWDHSLDFPRVHQ